MDLHKLKYVVEIAHQKSLDRAAKQLYISQPTLSIFLKRLETELGYPLFVRRNGKYVPTPEGEIYIQTCRKILKLADKMNAEIAALHEQTIRFGIPILEHRMFSILLKDFQQNHPGVCINTMINSSPELYQAVVEDRLDCAYATSWFPDVGALYPLTQNTIVREYEIRMYFSRTNPLLADMHASEGVLQAADVELLNRCSLCVRPAPMIRQRLEQDLLPENHLKPVDILVDNGDTEMLLTTLELTGSYTILPCCQMPDSFASLSLPGHPVAYRVRMTQKNTALSKLTEQLIRECDALIASSPYEHVYQV